MAHGCADPFQLRGAERLKVSDRADTCTANPDLPATIGLFLGSTVSTATEFGAGPSQDLCPAGEAGATIITGTMSAGLTLYLKVDGLNENLTNGNPAYEGVFTLEWALPS